MSLDVQDLYLIHAIGDRNNLRQRAQTIEDTTGVKPASVEDYRSSHGGFGIMKSLLWGIVAAGVTAAITVGAVALAAPAAATAGLFLVAAGSTPVMTALMATAPVIGFLTLSIGMLTGQLSLAKQNQKITSGYSNYLDTISSRIREAEGKKPLAVNVEYDVPDRNRTFVADIAASKQLALAAGNNR